MKLRSLLLAAPVAAASILAGCTSTQITSAAATIESDIQAGSAALCGVIPTVTSILDVVSAVVPGGSVLSVAGSAVTAVEADICSAAPPAASARYKALPRASSPGLPATIGTTQHGVVVSGWRA